MNKEKLYNAFPPPPPKKNKLINALHNVPWLIPAV